MKEAFEQLKTHLNTLTILTEEAWADFKTLFHPAIIAKGAYFAREGERPYKLAFLHKGLLRAYFLNEKGQEYNKSFYLEGSLYCAYSSIILNTPNYINIQAMEDCELLIADYHRVVDLYDRHPCLERFGRRAAEFLFAKKELREIRMVTLQADELYQQFQEDYPDLEYRLPQYHIASYLGITPVQLSRIRAKRAMKK